MTSTAAGSMKAKHDALPMTSAAVIETMRSCRFSIIVTCFNQRFFIRETIESALIQGADEVIVVDDGSNDGSIEILQEYRDRVRLCSVAKNGGAPRARNQGALMATGDYLLFLDGDDILVPWALAVYKCVLERRDPVVDSWRDGVLPRIGASSNAWTSRAWGHVP